MAQTCIVCLGDLRALGDVNSPSGAPEHVDPEANHTKKSLRNTRLASKIDLSDDEIIAHLLPCNHDLHNSCLKPWVERANSCPICRTTFNMVELSLAVGGEVIDSYGVQDKTQQAEIDPTLTVEYDPVLDSECELCGAWAALDDMISCHFCDYTVHTVCAGFDPTDDTQDSWACHDCTIRFGSAGRRLPYSTPRRLERSGGRSWRRTSAPGTNQGSSSRANHNDGMWARIWMGVSRQLDLDLDFPFDTDDDIATARTPEQRREFSRWQRRFELAERQGNSRRFHDLASRLRNHEQRPAPQPEPESQDVLRAWNAFEKARESQEAPPSVRRKRRRSHESTPGPDSDNAEPQQLKRPRLRPPPPPSIPQPQVTSDIAGSSAQHTVAEPTFLSSLLKEVEQHPVTAGSPSDAVNDQHSPRNSSPARSPSSSGCATPVLPSTPPPQFAKSPPLSSTIAPPISPPGLTFSPFSPTGDRRHSDHTLQQQQQQQQQQQRRGRPRDSAGKRPDRNSSSSPGAQLSYSSKEEIQRMVKLALGGRYRDGEITKDQYTDINRDISRKMYDMVGDASALSNETERAKWQAVAEREVGQAVNLLQTVIDDSGTGSS